MAELPERRFPAWLGIGVLLLIWEVAGDLGLSDPRLLPPPSAAIKALWQSALDGELFLDIYYSTARALGGFLIGSVVAVITGTLCARISYVNDILTPVVQILRPIPVIALVPLTIVWFGLGEVSKVFMVAWGVFFPVWVATLLGVSGVDRKYVWAAESLGADRRTLWLHVLIPAALPTIISGLRTSISLAFIVLVAAEMAGAFFGVGYRISAYHLVFETEKMIGYIVVIGMLGFAADRLFAVLVDRIVPWYRVGSGK